MSIFKDCSFNGRVARGEYLFLSLKYWFFGFVFALIALLSWKGADTALNKIVTSLLGCCCIFFSIIPQICLSVKRLHDCNMGGFWLLIPCIIGIVEISCGLNSTISSIASVIQLIVLVLVKGTHGSNQYGDDMLIALKE